MQLAAAFSKLNPPPKRSVLFMCTTAEEAGLLGAKFYAQHPLYPLEKTLADINIDSMNVWGKARDVEDTSFGFSTLDDMLADAAKRQGRTAIPNSRPEKGSIYRADNFEFSKVGAALALHRQRRTSVVTPGQRAAALRRIRSEEIIIKSQIR